MSWISVSVAGAGLALKGIDYVQAGNRGDKAQSYLNELRKTPYQNMTANPALMNFYSGAVNGVNNPQGLIGGEKAAFNSGVANQTNTIYKNAVNISGGNLSKFISNALIPTGVNAQNNLVGQDAGIRRQNQQSAYGRLGSAVSQLQSIDNQNVLNANNRKMLAENAAGTAVAQNNAFQTNTLESLGSDLLGGGLMLGMGGFNPSATQTPSFSQKAKFYGTGGFAADPGSGAEITPGTYAPNINPIYGAMGFNNDVRNSLRSRLDINR